MITDTGAGQTNYCPNCEDQDAPELVEYIDSYVRQLAPHQHAREAAKLLVQSRDKLEQLYRISNSLTDEVWELNEAVKHHEARIEELERRERMLVEALKYVHPYFIPGKDCSDRMTQHAEELIEDALNATPSHSAAWEWNQHVEWMRKNLQIKAWIQINKEGREICIASSELNSPRQSYDVRSEWKSADALVAIPELKEVKE